MLERAHEGRTNCIHRGYTVTSKTFYRKCMGNRWEKSKSISAYRQMAFCYPLFFFRSFSSARTNWASWSVCTVNWFCNRVTVCLSKLIVSNCVRFDIWNRTSGINERQNGDNCAGYRVKEISLVNLVDTYETEALLSDWFQFHCTKVQSFACKRKRLLVYRSRYCSQIHQIWELLFEVPGI